MFGDGGQPLIELGLLERDRGVPESDGGGGHVCDAWDGGRSR